MSYTPEQLRQVRLEADNAMMHAVLDAVETGAIDTGQANGSSGKPTTQDKNADLTWQEYANCLGVDPDLFFPERGASTREAKEVCRACVVRDECLEYALTSPMERFGIWGGMSERERRRVNRQRSLAAEAASVSIKKVLTG